MNVLALNINDKKYNYGKFVLKDGKVEKNDETFNLRPKNCFKTKKRTKKVQLDSAFVNYLIRELMISEFYRVHFIQKWTAGHHDALTLVVKPTKYDLIDYNWNERVYLMVREKCELDHALSWLSTLGGAFSALGDYFPVCAETAGKISIHQLKLALRLGDPNVATRCRLYLSLSLIQKKKFKYAKRIIYREYQLSKTATVIDPRLLNMCRGIWSKLQYEDDVFRRTKRDLSHKLKKIVI